MPKLSASWNLWPRPKDKPCRICPSPSSFIRNLPPCCRRACQMRLPNCVLGRQSSKRSKSEECRSGPTGRILRPESKLLLHQQVSNRVQLPDDDHTHTNQPSGSRAVSQSEHGKGDLTAGLVVHRNTLTTRRAGEILDRGEARNRNQRVAVRAADRLDPFGALVLAFGVNGHGASIASSG